MMATIRTGARLFKAAVDQIRETKQTITETANEICCRAKNLARKFKQKIRSFFSFFKARKHKKSDPILIHLRPKPKVKIKNKQLKKNCKAKRSKPKNAQANAQAHHKIQMRSTTQVQVNEECLPRDQIKEVEATKATPSQTDSIDNFYLEWEENWGPALTGLDKEFLESASPEVVSKVIENGRLTLKSPYLKAVYNGLKDLQDISDLLENDVLAKAQVMPLFKEYWDKGPEKFTDFLLCMHDKGVYPTRSGERRLSLDPRLVPEWLGLMD